MAEAMLGETGDVGDCIDLARLIMATAQYRRQEVNYGQAVAAAKRFRESD